MAGGAGVDNAGYLCHLHRFEYWLVQTTRAIPYIYIVAHIIPAGMLSDAGTDFVSPFYYY